MKIVLAGSPNIAIEAFEKVIKNFNVIAIITQPDRPKGRGLEIKSTPVALLGEKYNIKTYKPNKIGDIYNELKELDFDILLTFAFGQYIPSKILQLPKLLALNIHGSILPKYRGAAPIHHAILNGDKEIGISLIEMIKEMDAGNIYYIAKSNINNKTTTGDAINIISDLAKENIVDWLTNIESVTPILQGSNFSLSPKIEKSFGELLESDPIETNTRKIMALTPFPSAYIIKNNKRIKVLDYSLEEKNNSVPIKCSDGTIYATKYMIEGKKLVSL